MSQRRIFFLSTVIAGILFALVMLLKVFHLGEIPDVAFMVVRLLFITTLTVLAFNQGTLNTWIFLSMFVGIEVGLQFPGIALNLEILSKIFLQLIKTIIAPLLFATLVVGIAGHSDLKQVGRLGIKSISYFIAVTLIALIFGLFAINLSKAGHGVEKPETVEMVKADPKTWKDLVLHSFPENIAKSVAEGQVLQIVIFSILFGIGLSMVAPQHKPPMLDFANSLAEVMFKFTNLVMYLAPLAVGGALAYTVSKFGLGVLEKLGMLVLTLYGGLLAFVFIVFGAILMITRIPIGRFFKAVKEPVTLAFATASSESALPKAMKAMEDFGVPRKIVAFVIPTGYSFNLDGTTLYLSVATIFVAQAAGIQLTVAEQIPMLLVLLLTSKGVAGIPRASLMVLSAAAASFNLPEWPIAMIIGVDAIMDMARTSVNVLGNCLASVVIAKWEGEFNPGT